MNTNSVIEKESYGAHQQERKVIMPFEKRGEFYIDALGELSKKPFYEFVKRVSDIVIAVIFLLVLIFPMVIIGVIIKCSSKGSVLFHQDRLGFKGKSMTIIKFRTMHSDAESNGAQWCSGENDERIFPFGRILRKTRLDELPQLWNIIKGDMSFVGPRPERKCFYDEFETYIHGFSERLKVKPGLTGWAQVNGGYDLRPEEKILYDVEYIKNRSLWLDFLILFRTVKVVFTHDGAK